MAPRSLKIRNQTKTRKVLPRGARDAGREDGGFWNWAKILSNWGIPRWVRFLGGGRGNLVLGEGPPGGRVGPTAGKKILTLDIFKTGVADGALKELNALAEHLEIPTDVCKEHSFQTAINWALGLNGTQSTAENKPLRRNCE